MARTNRTVKTTPGVESLEGRALLTAGVHAAAVPAAFAGFLGGGRVKTDPAGVAAIVGALRGGPGSEFVTLIRRQVPNLSAVLGGFIRGRTTEFSTPGVAVKIPKFQDLYTGPRFDNLSATVAGAVLLKNGPLELGAILRGPFNEAPPSYVVFGIDRGAGARLGPAFASRPNLTPDALVTVAVGPYGGSATATVTDLTTGATTPVSPSSVQINGPVVRVFLDPASLPSTGAALSAYRFALWTRSQPGGGIENVGSFVPESSMDRVGVLRGRGR